MWKQLWDYVKGYAVKIGQLQKQTEQNAASLKDLQQAVEELTEEVRELRYGLSRLEENQRHEFEKLLLRLENALLRHGIRPQAPGHLLPPAEDDERSTE